MKSTSTTANQLEQMFQILNQQAFGGILETPIITIMSAPRTYGHVTATKVWKRDDGSSYELNLSAENLQRPIAEVAATMIHEMAHLTNLQTRTQDTSRNGTYHNKQFKHVAEATGLVKIDRHVTYGWTITTPTKALEVLCNEMGWEQIKINRGGGKAENGYEATRGPESGENEEVEKDTPRKKESYRRYVCPSCGLIARATKECKLICGTCREKMKIEN